MKITCKNAYRSFAPHGNYLAFCLGFLAVLPLLQCLSLALLEISASILIVLLLPIFLIVSDAWIFGGSCSGQSGWSECLKTSVRGTDILRKALIQNCILRLAVTVFIIAFSITAEWYFMVYRLGYEMFAGEVILRTLQKILVVYAASALGSLISRHFVQIIWYFVFGYLAAVVPTIVCTLADRGTPLILSILLGAVCSVLFSVITGKLTLNKMRRGYYDKTVEI